MIQNIQKEMMYLREINQKVTRDDKYLLSSANIPPRMKFNRSLNINHPQSVHSQSLGSGSDPQNALISSKLQNKSLLVSNKVLDEEFDKKLTNSIKI